jgi:hypothetical protein
LGVPARKTGNFAKSSTFHYLLQKITFLADSRQYRSAEDWVNHLLAKGKYAPVFLGQKECFL